MFDYNSRIIHFRLLKMSGTSPYWIANDGYAAKVTTSPPAALDLSFSNDRNLHVSASLSKQPQAYVATHPNIPHGFDIAVVGNCCCCCHNHHLYTTTTMADGVQCRLHAAAAGDRPVAHCRRRPA